MTRVLRNLRDGAWVEVPGDRSVPVTDPATGEVLAIHPLSDAAEVDRVVRSAADAFWAWRLTPVPERAARLFRFRHLLASATEELATIITEENGKTLAESRGELMRAIQYVEHAAAAPELMKGSVSENISTSVDIEAIREPLGPFAVIAPFNFPAMIPLYFAWTVATGNTVVLKPSELCPLTAIRMIELAMEAGFPPGVINVVLGDAVAVERLCEHPDVIGVTFVGSSHVARSVYALATSHGKRAQAQGGAKNHLVVTESAVLERVLPNIVSSMYGNASQRCFAGSNLLVVRSVYDRFLTGFTTAIDQLVLGGGKDPQTTLGPVISAAAKDAFVAAIDRAEAEGATLLRDGRGVGVEGLPNGHWLGPTLVEADPQQAIWREELFGPVRGIVPVDSVDEAIGIINASDFGHTAVVYTEHGGVARAFRQQVQTGQVGINVGTPAPIAFYPVGGRKSSFYGDLRGRANDAVDFYTDQKIVVSTWHHDTVQETGVDPTFEGRV
jgi:malonate-semialdehyde dehydrogenase (acetylating) / methylmalonate-semialdehyde dehydrogenase